MLLLVDPDADENMFPRNEKLDDDVVGRSGSPFPAVTEEAPALDVVVSCKVVKEADRGLAELDDKRPARPLLSPLKSDAVVADRLPATLPLRAPPTANGLGPLPKMLRVLSRLPPPLDKVDALLDMGADLPPSASLYML